MKYWRLLSTNRNYRNLWLGQLISETGDWAYAIVLYALLLEFTGRAETVGLALVMQVLPQVFVSPIAGAINDRLSRRRVMIFADVARCFVMLGLLLVRTPAMIPLLWVLLATETVLWAFFEPARSAVIPLITRDEEERATANALGGITWSACFFLGSSCGGWLAAYTSRDFVFTVDALSFLVSGCFIWRMRFEEPHTEGHAPMRISDIFDFKPILEGVRYLTHDARRVTLLMVKSGMGWIGANYVILSVMGTRDFPLTWTGRAAPEAGLLGISALMAARGVGAISGPAIGHAVAGADHGRMRWGITLGFLAAGLGYIGLSRAASFWPAFAAVVLAHAGASVVWTFSATFMQSFSDDKFRGRVMAADFAALTLSLAIASYSAGVAVDLGVPVRTVALIVGLIMFVPLAVWLLRTRGWSGSA